MKNKLSVILLFFSWITLIHAQPPKPNKLLLSGTIYGYSFDPSKKILGKNNDTELEGALGAVQIKILHEKDVIASLKTANNGEFALYVPLENELKFQFSKSDYVTSSFLIDMSDVPDNIANRGVVFNQIELVLNSFVSDYTDDPRPFGRLFYNSDSRALDFKKIVYEDKQKLFKKEDKSPLNLMNGSIQRNLTNNDDPGEAIVNNSNGTQKIENSNSEISEIENVETTNSSKKGNGKFIRLSKLNLDDIDESSIQQRELELKKAWDQIEIDRQNATTPEEFLLIEAREELLIAAEKELRDAKKYIALQKEEIAAQRLKLIFLIGLLAVLCVFGFFVFRSMKQKIKLNKELSSKNKKIMTSINYAYRIQQSILMDEKEIAEILPRSFVFYQPLDIVSGDFYWITKIDKKIIVAVVDCTGHGVPGAFMSLIANTLLNQIVNEKRITDPVKILDDLHDGVVKSLRQKESEKNNQDGMDMSLVIIHEDSRKIEYTGAMNPIYLVEDGEISILETPLRGIGGIEKGKRKRAVKFDASRKDIKPGATLYLTSDGFMDQFGGPENRKFNLPRFKELLLKADNTSIKSRKGIFEKAYQDWKKNTEQTDDILVMGIEL